RVQRTPRVRRHAGEPHDLRRGCRSRVPPGACAGRPAIASRRRPVLRRPQRHARRSVRPRVDRRHAHRGCVAGRDGPPHGPDEVTAMYTLYGSQGSGAAAAEAALVLANIPFRMVDAASWQPGPGLDELTRMNPLAQIPTLVLPDGSVMTESAAILVHLGLAHPGSELLPADATPRAQIVRGLVYVAANCYAAIGVIDYPERWCKDAGDDDKKRI